MHPEESLSERVALAAITFLVLLATLSAAAPAQVPFACNGEVLITQGVDAQLSWLDQSTSPVTLQPIGAAAGVEYNNMGFRSTDGLLYALQITPGRFHLVQIDSAGTVLELGWPVGLPQQRFDAGDVTPDGGTMYVTIGQITNGLLYAIDLTAAGYPQRPGFPKAITGDDGAVHDWAVDPITGLLFGADKTDGELAILDPATGLRVDLPHSGTLSNVLPLPQVDSYGAAWFDGSDNLFLYRNNGQILEIGFGIHAFVAATHAAPASDRNDGAICRQQVLGTAKNMEREPGGLPSTVTLEYVFGNFSPSVDLFDLSAMDDLEAVFGAHGFDWTFTSISSTPAALANPAFDGHTETELIAFPNSLPASSTATVTVTIELLGLSALPADGYFCNQITTTGETAAGVLLGDLSTRGFLVDPDGNGSAVEREPSCLDLAEPLPCAAYVMQGESSQLYRVDPTVSIPDPTMSPFAFTPIGGPAGKEINNIGYRESDGLLYGVELSPLGNVQIVRIDGNGSVFELGAPPGLPASVRFDAGDVSLDDQTLYLHAHGQPLYRLSLASLPKLPMVTSVPIAAGFNHTGIVHDWALDPESGLLFGGDSTYGEIASLDPATGLRQDNPGSGTSSAVVALPRGVAYGAAWLAEEPGPFSPYRLFLYRNHDLAGGGDRILEIAFPPIHYFVADEHSSPAAERNDGAACLP